MVRITHKTTRKLRSHMKLHNVPDYEKACYYKVFQVICNCVKSKNLNPHTGSSEVTRSIYDLILIIEALGPLRHRGFLLWGHGKIFCVVRVDTLKCPQKNMSIKSRRGIFHSGSSVVLNNSIRIGTRLNEILFFRYPLFFNFGNGHPITYWYKQ